MLRSTEGIIITMLPLSWLIVGGLLCWTVFVLGVLYYCLTSIYHPLIEGKFIFAPGGLAVFFKLSSTSIKFKKHKIPHHE
jgi:hypothetical protein